jgi:CheY-like chemotaxis protein
MSSSDKINTILWADDDTDDLLLMKEILGQTNHQFEIVEVANGREALSFLHKSKEAGHLPCLIILDINMPVMDGKETLAEIKRDETLKKLPVVVFTTSNSELDKLFCKRLNVELITKPPSYQLLEKTVLDIVGLCDTKAA